MPQPVLVILPSVLAAGAEVQAMLQIRELQARGVSVSLMVLSRMVDEAVLAEARLPEASICRLRNPANTLGGAFLRHLWRDLPRAARFAQAQGARIVIAHLPPGHLFARLLYLVCLARGPRLRVIQYHHSVERKLNPADTIGKRAFAVVNGTLARLADHSHWHVSNAVERDLAGGFTRRNAVLPNACETGAAGDRAAAEALLNAIPGDPYIILFPGRLKSMKGHLMFLDAFARLCQAEGAGPEDLHLVIAGEGDQREAIEAAIGRHRLAAQVTLLGAVPHSALLGLNGRAELVVVPSLDEGFGNVAIEAIAQGALVLGSDAGGLAEVLRDGENALVFPAGDVEALTGQLTEIWHHRAEPFIDAQAAQADCAARFGLGPQMDRMIALLDVAGGD
ncbi:MAG: glycosyltransferase family 4 protein [Paracoccaceae bacterium]|nr:glycosyltransferase family 4 protein [Paracoccaceae bacterium]